MGRKRSLSTSRAEAEDARMADATASFADDGDDSSSATVAAAGAATATSGVRVRRGAAAAAAASSSSAAVAHASEGDDDESDEADSSSNAATGDNDATAMVVSATELENEAARSQVLVSVQRSKQVKPAFGALKPSEIAGGLDEVRKIPVPAHRYTPLKENWPKLVAPIVQHLKLQIRMNTHSRNIEVRTCTETEDIASLQRAADFLQAFILGFAVEDALSLLRLDDLYIESFEIKDVKRLAGDHMSRAIGRLAGKDGRTKFTIENCTRTRIVLADSKIHILGSFNNIQIARNAVCDLILGSPPGKIFARLRALAGRIAQRF